LTGAASPQSSHARMADRAVRVLGAHRAVILDISIVVALSVLARLPWVLIVHAVPTSDSYFYFLSAKSIAAGHGYSILGHPTAFFPVGWPGFLAGLFSITGPSYAAIEVLNIVLWAVSGGLVYALGRRLGGRAVGLVAGILVAVAPTITIYAMRAPSEALFIPLLLIVCLLLTGRRETPSLRRAAIAGVLLGVAILVRSTAELLPLLLPLWLLLRRPRRESWRAALVLAVTSGLVLVPWAVRNEVVMHSFALSTNGGYTLWIGANPDATGGFGVRGQHPKWGIESAASEVRQDTVLTSKAISFAVHHPAQWLGLVPAKFGYLMSWGPGPLRNALQGQTGSDPRVGFYDRHLDPAAKDLVDGALNNRWAFSLWHYLYWVLGGAALILATWRRRPTATIALLLVAFWIVFHITLVHGEPRYMLSVTPLLAPALAWLLVGGTRRLGATIRRRHAT
jgi:4-amino-4-deoxy-L-arabinose transferase-like glycosyltransferase